jgi:glycerol-3-phosphate dehydrogenase
MDNRSPEFSYRTRAASLRKFRDEVFDLLIIGGGITGAAVARDAASRGLKVALVERKDFAYGTSSRSSKLIHGGLRYLQNFEFGLVFEALSERARLLRTAPHMVRPLPFFFPVYQGDPNGKTKLGLGLWLYDLLALFRAPGFHQNLSKKALLEQIPYLRQEGLQGGFRYFDASMWDDGLVVETLRAAQSLGAAVANYTEAVGPLWGNERIEGFRVRESEGTAGEEFPLRAHRTIVCAGPWTDQVGAMLSPQWRNWLNPSKGVHLVFDLKRIPIPGAMVMSHPEDGRISFVMPRPDLGNGVVIVGTTDGPTSADPEAVSIDPSDVTYLLGLLARYFPELRITSADILSAYVGVRPLMGAHHSDEPQAEALQKVSREHFIGMGPGGTVVVAGGKYTTHRKMAEEIVDFTLKEWRLDARHGKAPAVPAVRRSSTKTPVNPRATAAAVETCRVEAATRGAMIPEKLLDRYGAEAVSVMGAGGAVDLEGFPMLAAQLRHTMRSEMVVRLEDFYLRRVPLYAARSDHGLPQAEALARVWADERGLGEDAARAEEVRLREELARRSEWQKQKVVPTFW